ncbi:MAG: glycine cleavage system aminomethyltransferase GcvT [Alphaproteobacteria bacterium]
MTLPQLRTSLYNFHTRHGAKMVSFAGYDMPVQYPEGIIAEHLHTRAAASLFDVGHMGQILLHCPLEDLARLVPTDLAALQPMQTTYSLLLNNHGGVIDDLMITRLNPEGDQWFLIVNAALKRTDLEFLQEHIPTARTLTLRDDLGLLALQGPGAVAALEKICPSAVALKFMHLGQYDIPDHGVLRVWRSGYTGEDGFEISLPSDQAESFATALLELPNVKPAGLGARDTLRLEAGLCLYGHELNETISPVEASLNWVVSPTRRAKADFPGAPRILEELQQSASRRRVGLLLPSRAIVREGNKVLSAGGNEIGFVSSGGYSPTLDTAIAMAYLTPAQAMVDLVVQLPLRGRAIPARIVKLPFVPHRYMR